MTARTVQSRKAKGRKAQQDVAAKILETFPDLTERDVVSQPMGSNDEDIRLSETAFRKFPYAIEVKAQEKLNIWAALKQSEQPNRNGTPIVMFKRSRSPMYVCLTIDNFFNIISELNHYKNMNRDK